MEEINPKFKEATKKLLKKCEQGASWYGFLIKKHGICHFTSNIKMDWIDRADKYRYITFLRGEFINIYKWSPAPGEFWFLDKINLSEHNGSRKEWYKPRIEFLKTVLKRMEENGQQPNRI